MGDASNGHQEVAENATSVCKTETESQLVSGLKLQYPHYQTVASIPRALKGRNIVAHLQVAALISCAVFRYFPFLGMDSALPERWMQSFVSNLTYAPTACLHLHG